MLISATFARAPLLTLTLIAGLLIALGALLLRLNDMVFGAAPESAGQSRYGTNLPLVLHLTVVLIAGLWLPPPFQRISSSARACRSGSLASRWSR